MDEAESAERVETNTPTEPVQKWYQTLDRLGEWLVVGSIASLGLPAVPGIASLGLLVWFFAIRQQNQPHESMRRIDALKDRRLLTAVEDAELQQLRAQFKALTHHRSYRTGMIGFSFWMLALLYLLVVRGYVQKNWF